MEDPLALEATAPPVQTGHNNVVRAHQHRVPVQKEAVAHQLLDRRAVTVKQQEALTHSVLRYTTKHNDLITGFTTSVVLGSNIFNKVLKK